MVSRFTTLGAHPVMSYFFGRTSKPVSHCNRTVVTRKLQEPVYFGQWKISFLKALDEQRTNNGNRNV